MYKDANKMGTSCEYNTPIYVFRYLDDVFHFKIDPCASPDNFLRTDIFYTRKDNGLTKSWDQGSVYANPPYGYGSEEMWINKCIEEYTIHGFPIFILLPVKTEAKWFGKAFIKSSVVIFPEGRIPFIREGKAATSNIMGSVIFGFCSKPEDLQFQRFNDKLGVLYCKDALHTTYFPSLKTMRDHIANEV